MPPLPRISLPALVRLAEELRFAPRDALLRDLDRIEGLALELDADGSYPEEWVVFRVTGFRADAPESAPIAGAALLRDLSALAERLSAAARLEAPDPLLTLDDLAARWNVSRKTIERLRRRGLVARRVLDGAGRSRLSFSPAVVDAFASSHREEIDRAASFSRTPSVVRARVLRGARLYRAAGLSLNQAAQRLARRYGRSHEAIRQQLIRNDQEAIAGDGSPIFGWRGPVRASRAHGALARIAQGTEPRAIARRLGRSPGAVRRAVNVLRAERLRTLTLPTRAGACPDTLTGGVLDTSHASEGLGGLGQADLLEFIRAARRREVPLGVVERARAAASRELLWRAGVWIRGLDRASPSPHALDRIETSLRWSARLVAELLRSHIPLIIETIEARASLRLDEQRAARALQLVELGLEAGARAIEAFDPAKGGRLAAPISMLVTREVARWLRAAPPMEAEPAGRAAPRLTPGVPLLDWTRRVATWQEWLEPDPGVRAGADRVGQEARVAVSLRHGWPEWSPGTNAAPVRPHTCAEIAALLGLTPTAVARLERRALREALGSRPETHTGGSN